MKKGWTGKAVQRRTYALHQQSNFKMHRQNKYTLNTHNTQAPTCPESTALPRTSPLRTLYILPSRQITEMRHSTSNNPEIESSTGTEGNCTLHRYDELEGSCGNTNIWPVISTEKEWCEIHNPKQSTILICIHLDETLCRWCIIPPGSKTSLRIQNKYTSTHLTLCPPPVRWCCQSPRCLCWACPCT